MSWAEENGSVEMEENPDPEEDSDLPQRQHQEGEEVGFRSEEDGPEEDLVMAQENVTNVQGMNTGEADVHPPAASMDLNSGAAIRSGGSNSALTDAQVDGLAQASATSNQENIDGSVIDGDSFEQDEDTAAPECENNVRQGACSESDRQLFQFEETVFKSDTDSPIQDDTYDLHASLHSIPEHEIQVQETSSKSNDEAVNCVINHQNVEIVSSFNGDIEIVSNFDDAPEAEVGSLKKERGTYPFEEEDNLNLFPGQVGSENSNHTLLLSGHIEQLEEADAVLDVRIVAGTPRNESAEQVMHECADPDMQAPECDRETVSYPQMSIAAASCDNDSGDQLPTLEQAVAEYQGQVPPDSAACITEALPQNDKGTQSPTELSSSDCSGTQTCCVSEELPGVAVVANTDHDETGLVHSVLVSVSDHLTQSTGHQQDMPSCADHPSHIPQSSLQVDQPKAAELPNQPANPSSSIPIQYGEIQANPSSSIPIRNGDSPVNPTDTKRTEHRSSSPVLQSPSHGVSSVRDQQSSDPKFGCQLHLSGSSSQASTPVTSQHSSPNREHSKVLAMDNICIEKELAFALQSDDEDELLHELDAELLAHASRAKSAQRSAQEHAAGLSQKESFGPSLNGFQPLFDFAQIHEHNRQLLEQLRIRDEEIGKLTRERDSVKETLAQAQSQLEEQQKLSSHSTDDLYLSQIKTLENTVAQQQVEVKALKEKLVSHDSAAKRAVTTLQSELKSRVDQITKMYEECLKEKDMMVVKFAESEAKSMEAKRVAEKNEAKLREVMREKDNLVNASKSAVSDKQKAVANFEAKCAEVSNMQKELEKLKEAVNSSEYRIKWFQNKLKDELENHKETKSNLEKVTTKLKETKEETEVIRKECQAIVKRYQESEEIKSNSLDKELKMKENELRTQMQEKFDTEEIHQLTKRELESLKAQHKDTLEEVKAYKDKVHCLEEERRQNHQMIENYQEIMQKQKADILDLKTRVKSLTTLEDDYKRAQDMIYTLDKDITELKVANRDLQKDIESCRERESKMLTLQSELSRTSALLRSENTNLSNKASNLTAEVEKLKMELQELETTVKDLSDKYEEEKTRRKEEVEKIGTTLAEKTKECSEIRQKWEDEIDNSKTLKRRHANNVKDLTRQLHQVRKRLETLEEKGEASSMGSRTNSNGSLNSIENSSQQSAVVHQQPVQEFPVITEQVEVDKQLLIERIVRLQKSHARKSEKLEFLGEHIQQLLEEIRKKNKIIQSYALREESGTLSSEDMDANKAEIQREIQTLLARKGGIMASLYSVHQQDGSMTLELSLQINRKLQAVFEDTLLKNITLKENLDTLGEEIARLSQENRRLQLHIQETEGHLA